MWDQKTIMEGYVSSTQVRRTHWLGYLHSECPYVIVSLSISDIGPLCLLLVLLDDGNGKSSSEKNCEYTK